MVLSEAEHMNMHPAEYADEVLTSAFLEEPQGWLFIMKQWLRKLKLFIVQDRLQVEWPSQNGGFD